MKLKLKILWKRVFNAQIKAWMAKILSHNCLIVEPRMTYMKQLTFHWFSKFKYHVIRDQYDGSSLRDFVKSVISHQLHDLWLVDLTEWTYYDWLLQLFDYSQLSNYNCTERLVKKNTAYAPITFERIVVVIVSGNRSEWSPIRSVIIRVINKIGGPRSGSPICQSQVHSGESSPVKTISEVKNSSTLKKTGW